MIWSTSKQVRRHTRDDGIGAPRATTSDKSSDITAATDDPQDSFLTTSDGVRVSTTNDSLKAGNRGPTLIQDFHFQEKLSHFDRERIPERVVHARGSAAHGVFTPYESCADITSAAFLQDTSVTTPVFCRFSTVAGFKGSADTVRDVRGFAVKFYTQEGNFDLVGNDLPVFFIQDAIKFPDFVHAVKPEPDNEMPQAASAHDTFWDFISLQPEATHMVMWAMSDRGVPRSLRTIEGFGVHTFVMTNAQGNAHFVKFHWKPLQGLRSNVWDEQQKIAGKNADFNRQDLWEAIEAGNYPEWELGLQVVPVADEFAFDFDLLDPTKLIPEEDVPVRIVGKMTLNRNPENFFAEVEQVALHPGRFVPGIGASNDPLLQGRMFSYLDTQMHRLGGANFTQLPINRPLADVNTNERGGQHQTTVHTGKASYFPNSTGGGCPAVADPANGAYVHWNQPVEGEKLAQRAASFQEHFSQATLFWNSQTAPEQDHIVQAMTFELSKVKDPVIRERVVAQFNNVDNTLASRVAQGLGLPVPAPVVANHGRSSVALSIDGRERVSITAANVGIFVADGFDAAEVQAITAALEAEGARYELIGPSIAVVTDSAGGTVRPVQSLKTGASVFYDALVVPSGSGMALAKLADAVDWIRECYRHYKPILAAGDGVDVLKGSALNGATLEPGADADKGVLVATSSDASVVDAFVRMVYQGRFWNRPAEEA